VASAGSGEGVPPIISTGRHFVVSVFLISLSVASISQVWPTFVRTQELLRLLSANEASADQ
jgi:hypothetical protein